MIVHRTRHRDWALPKGKLDRGESFERAAVREMREETGCVAELAEFAGACAYVTKGRPKVVLFWQMTLVSQQPIKPNDEIAEAIWLPIDEAARRLTYGCERDLVMRVFSGAKADERP
jgi:8-oxo-dGTP diphosphatase